MTQPLLPTTRGSHPCHLRFLTTKNVVRKTMVRWGLSASPRPYLATEGGGGAQAYCQKNRCNPEFSFRRTLPHANLNYGI